MIKPPPRPSVVLFSTADWNTRFWTNKQHNAAALARRGYRVLYVETVGLRRARLSDRRDVRRLFSRLVRGLRSLIGPTKVQGNVWVLSPLTIPWAHRWPLVQSLNAALLRFALSVSIQVLQLDGAQVWTYHPYVLQALRTLRLGRLSYHCVDDLSAVSGVDPDAFLQSEVALLRECHAVFVTGRLLEERCRAHNSNVHFFTNVVDADHFGQAFTTPQPDEFVPIPHPRLGYHGVLSDAKLDCHLLEALMQNHPHWQLILIGEEREGQNPASFASLRRLDNVHFLGTRPYADLPRYLGGLDVGIIPLAENAYTASMYPMKLFEFLAAGTPVVATDAPYLRDAPPSVDVAVGPDGLADAIERQLKRGRLTPQEARDVVGDHTWDARLSKILAITEAP